jgi:hypothetical protein
MIHRLPLVRVKLREHPARRHRSSCHLRNKRNSWSPERKPLGRKPYDVLMKPWRHADLRHRRWKRMLSIEIKLLAYFVIVVLFFLIFYF